MVTPPPATAADTAVAAQAELDALRAQLAGTEAALATANEQLTARNTLAALDLAATAGGDAPHGGFFPPPAGQAAPTATLATGPAAAAGTGAGAPAHCSLAAAPAARDGGGGDDDAAFLAAYDDEGASSAGGEWAPAPYDPSGIHGRPPAAGIGGHRGGAEFAVDDFDSAKRPSAGDYLRSFAIPHDVRRADGLPVPFKPVDNIHATDFAACSRDEHEARQWYQVLAWLQQLHNDALRVQHTDGITVSQYASFTDYVTVSSRRIFSIGAARYDYLAMRQSEPSLARRTPTRMPSPATGDAARGHGASLLGSSGRRPTPPPSSGRWSAVFPTAAAVVAGAAGTAAAVMPASPVTVGAAAQAVPAPPRADGAGAPSAADADAAAAAPKFRPGAGGNSLPGGANFRSRGPGVQVASGDGGRAAGASAHAPLLPPVRRPHGGVAPMARDGRLLLGARRDRQ